jgi:hypothetical protein
MIIALNHLGIRYKLSFGCMKKFLLFLFLLLLSCTGLAQTDEIPDITADRPGMATPANIMLPLKLQIESGSSYERSNAKDNFFENIYFNSTLLRFGINRNAEIRLQTDLLRARSDNKKDFGLNPLTLGTKVLLFKGRGVLPMTSVMMNVTLPWIGDKAFRPAHLSPSVYLLMQNDITDKLNVCYNFGAMYDEQQETANVFFALCLSYGITERFSAFVENYNWFASGAPPSNNIDLGFALVLHKNVQLDLSGNLNLQDLNNYFMINFGVAWRIIRNVNNSKVINK